MTIPDKETKAAEKVLKAIIKDIDAAEESRLFTYFQHLFYEKYVQMI